MSAGIIFAATELLFNALFGDFPIFFFRSGDPLIIIPFGALGEMGVWLGLALLLGGLVETFRRLLGGAPAWHTGLLLTASLWLEIYVITKLVDLALRDGIFKEPFIDPDLMPSEYSLVSILGVLGLLALVLGIAVSLSRRQASREVLRRDTVRIGIFVFLLAAVYALCYQRWVADFSWPVSFPWLQVGALILATLAGGFFLLRRQWGISRLAGVLFLAAAAAEILLAAWYSIPAGPAHPDIVVSLWDTARADRMSLYGYPSPTTPFLDSLSPHAVIFDYAYSPANSTYPSHITYFTGKSYRAHNYQGGSTEEIRRYRAESTLPGRLKELGYHTALVSENLWVVELDNGFDEVRYYPRQLACFDPFEQAVYSCRFDRPPSFWKYYGSFLGRHLVDAVRYGGDGFYKETLDRIQLRLVQKLFVRSRRLGPLFVFFNWMNVHERYHPFGPWSAQSTSLDYDLGGEYDLALRQADSRFGELHRQIRSWDRRRGRDTLVIMTSDHGEFLGEYNLFHHRHSLFPPVLRVPLVLYHPDIEGPVRVEQSVSMTGFRKLVEMLAQTPELIQARVISDIMAGPGVVISEDSHLPPGKGNYVWTYTVIDGEKQYVKDEFVQYRRNTTWPRDRARVLFARDRFIGAAAVAEGQDDEDFSPYEQIYSGYLQAIPEQKLAPPSPEESVQIRRKLKALGYLD